MFKNLSVYRIPVGPIDTNALESSLTENARLPCAPSAPQSIGWIPPRDGGAFVHAVNNQILIALGADVKLLPTSVVNQFAAEKAEMIEKEEGRRVGRKERLELRENATLELLPRAFIRRRTTFCWIDPINGWIVVDAAAPAKAEEVLGHLRIAFDFPVTLLRVKKSPIASMTGWVSDGGAPDGFSIDQDLKLCSEESAEVRYVKHPLEGEDIAHHIAAGKVATSLAMTWNDRISFVLTDTMTIKRLTFLDIIKEASTGQAETAEDQFDIDFVIMAGEVAQLLSSLVSALGGEVVPEAVF